MSSYIEDLAINYLKQNPGALQTMLPKLFQQFGPLILPALKDNPEVRQLAVNAIMPEILQSSLFKSLDAAIPANLQGFVFSNIKTFEGFTASDEGKALVGLFVEEWNKWFAKSLATATTAVPSVP